MRLDVVLPNEAVSMPPVHLVDLARLAEKLGYGTAYLPDHVLPPDDYGATFGGVYEPIVTIAHLTASTTTLRFGTSVLVLPLRNPFVLAKQVATVQQLSADRIVLGVGTGWSPEEFVAVGAEYRRRGRDTDDALAVIGHLFTEGAGPYVGRRYGFEQGVFAPRPATPVPILVGGNSDAALRRAAQFADSWQGLPVPPAEYAERVRALAALTGDRSVSPGVRIGWADDRPVEEVVLEVNDYRSAGAEHVAVHLGDWRNYPDRMTALATATRSA